MYMTIKINTQKLGLKKPIEIKPTTGLKLEANNIMIKMLEKEAGIETQISEESNTDDPLKVTINYFKQGIETIKEILDFVQKTLKLSDSQMEKIKYTIDDVELGEYAGYLVQRINGMSENDTNINKKDEIEKQKNEDPKKE